MAVHSGPNIVRDGIILSLDASTANSYPRSGTTWIDLSGNNYNATLTNGPVYDSSYLGKFTLDGTDDLINMSSSLLYPVNWTDNFTFEVWIYVPTGAAWSPPVSGYSTGVTGTIIGKGSYAGSMGLIRASGVGAAGNTLGIFLRGTTALASATSNITRDAWYQVVGTWDSSRISLYVNGLLNSSTSIAAASLGGSPFAGSLDFGGARAFGGNTGTTFAGQVSIIKMYNRPLTPDEVLKNFDMHKGRFGY